ncbi:hypothetical protein BJV78DRAFT_1288576 [Lactifluus subvellereus]|nr:hypothetical protein BJV78DRAFT_1288576 [Lactifluus subvellereus]
MSSLEHIFTPTQWDTPMDITPPPSAKPKRALPGDAHLLVFNIHNIFHHCWFLSRANLMARVISAQKAADGKISWVELEFEPAYHSHLVKCAVALVP